MPPKDASDLLTLAWQRPLAAPIAAVSPIELNPSSIVAALNAVNPRID